jgi:hypothetical protein
MLKFYINVFQVMLPGVFDKNGPGVAQLSCSSKNREFRHFHAHLQHARQRLFEDLDPGFFIEKIRLELKVLPV